MTWLGYTPTWKYQNLHKEYDQARTDAAFYQGMCIIQDGVVIKEAYLNIHSAYASDAKVSLGVGNVSNKIYPGMKFVIKTETLK